MVIKSVKSTQQKVFNIGKNAKAKIVIKDDSGNLHTVLNTYSGASSENYTISCTVTRPLTDKLGSFSITLVNDNGRFYNMFNGGEDVYIYIDVTDATTEIIRGKIDNVLYNLNVSSGFTVKITGRDFPEFVDKTITGIDSTSMVALALSRLLYLNYPSIKLAYKRATGSISTVAYDESTDSITWTGTSSGYPTTLITMSYQNKKGLTIIKEMCKRAGLDAYISYNKTKNQLYLYTFPSTGIVNSSAGISYGTNLISMSDYGTNNNDIFNRIIGYGKQTGDNIILLKTKSDIESQTNLWIKDKIINDSDASSMDELNQKVSTELSKSTNLTTNGRLTTIIIDNLSPGDVIPISVPYTGMNSSYKVHAITYKIDNNMSMSVDVSRAQDKLTDLFVGKNNPDDFLSGGNNLNAMTDSYNVYFNEDPSIVMHNGTQELDGVLRLETNKTYGIATMATLDVPYNVTQCEFRRLENYNTDDDVYEVSNNGGITWEVYDSASGAVHTFTTIGNKLTFRMKLKRDAITDAGPAYESVVLLYK